MSIPFTILCGSGAHCDTCRADPEWRAGAALVYEPVAACPKGYELVQGEPTCSRCGGGHWVGQCPEPQPVIEVMPSEGCC